MLKINYSKKYPLHFDTARLKRYLHSSNDQLHLTTGFLDSGRICWEILSDTDACWFCTGDEETSIRLVTRYFAIASQRRDYLRQKTCMKPPQSGTGELWRACLEDR